jgi:D-glycero-D-manno-heptose 1,7-bisphosphate phosphatase
VGSGPVIYLDRDGVINRHREDSVRTWADFEFLPGALEGLVSLTAAGFRLAVVTNQANVGRGILSEEGLNAIHRRMIAEIEGAGGQLSKVLVCPHRPEEGCACRKPAPGLLLRAARELGFPLRDSWLIGDDRTDLMAAHSARMHSILVLCGKESWPLSPGCPVPDKVAADLLNAAVLLTTAPPL